MKINLTSPAPKYHIKGIVEINLTQNKGPSMIAGRTDSVEKTPLSYINNNMNVSHTLFSQDQADTTQPRMTRKSYVANLTNKITKMY